MDAAAMMGAPEMEAPAGDPVRVANVCEAAVILAARGGLDGIVAAKRITLDFAEGGDVTVTVLATDGAEDSGVVTADAIRAIDDTDEDHEALDDRATRRR